MSNLIFVGTIIIPATGVGSAQALEAIVDEMDKHHKMSGDNKFALSMNIVKIVLMEFYPSVYTEKQTNVTDFWLIEASKVLNKLARKNLIFTKLTFLPITAGGWDRSMVVRYCPHIGLAATDELVNVLDI
jgi:hypothetical protein